MTYQLALFTAIAIHSTYAVDIQRKAEILTAKCYLQTNISPKDQVFIERLIAQLETATPTDLIHIADYVQKELYKKAHTLQKEADKTKSPAEKERIIYQLKLVKIQEKHLERFAKLTAQQQPIHKKAHLWLHSTFGTKNNTVRTIADDLLTYTQLERETILANPDTTISFFHAQNNATLPRIMAFWWYKPEQDVIIQRVRKIDMTLTACADALLEGAEVGEEATEVATVGEEEGVEEAVDNVSQEVANEDAQEISANEQLAQTLTDAEKAVQAFMDDVTEVTNKAENALQDAMEKASAEFKKANDALTNELNEAAAQLNQAKGIFDFLKRTYNKGLVGTTESVMKSSADLIENGLIKLSSKYPNSAALQIVTGTFKASRGVFGALYKFTPLGLIKWFSTSPSGKVMYDMLKMTLVMAGSSMYNSWINQQTFAAYQKLSTFSTQLGSAMQNTIATIQANFTTQNALLVSSSQTKLLQLTKNQQPIQSFNTQQINFLNNSLVAATVPQIYVAQPMYDDELFVLSPMLTPQQTTSNQTMAIEQAIQQAESAWQTAQTLNFKQQAQGSWAGPVVLAKKSLVQQAVSGTTNQSTTNLNPGAVSTQDVINTIPQQQYAYAPWHNIFRYGNWEFGITKNNDGTYQGSFTQNTVVPLSATSQNPAFLQALHNSIFTQYIPSALYYNTTETYVVQIACTLQKVSYPFFMGFYCNGGRWVSGVNQLRYQRRTYGVLGSAPGQSGIWFGETFYMQPNQALQSNVNAIWPLWQFFEGASQAPAWKLLNPNALIATQPLYTDPTPAKAQPLIIPGTTIIFTIVTQPTQVTLSAQIQGSNEPFMENVMVTGLNAQLFVYHNIGLIAAGCSASFNIIHPQALTYPEAALAEFFQEVQ